MSTRECVDCVYLLSPASKSRCFWVSDLCLDLPDKPKYQPDRGTLVKEVADLTRELSRLNAALSMEQLKHKTTEAEKLAAEYERDTARKERDEFKVKYQFMVDRACDQKLEGYRELGNKLAVTKELQEHAQAEANKLRLALKTAEIVSGRQVEKIESLEVKCNQLQDGLRVALTDIQQFAAQYCPMDTWPAEDREKFAALQELIS